MPRLHVVRDPSVDDPVATLAGVSDRTEAKLARLGIATIRDLLLFFPRRYEDFSTITPIAFVRPGVKTTVRGRIYDIGARQTKYKRMALTEAVLSDDSGSLRVVWFNQPWLEEKLLPGTRVRLRGQLRGNEFTVKSYDVAGANGASATSDLAPIYPAGEEITPPRMRALADRALALVDNAPNPLPARVKHAEQLPQRADGVDRLGELRRAPGQP